MTEADFIAEFARIKDEIEAEGEAKTELNQIESDVTNAIASYRSNVVDFATMHPDQINAKFLGEDSVDGFQEQLTILFQNFTSTLQSASGKNIHKSSILHNVTEEFIYLVLAYQYFKAVSHGICTADVETGPKSVLVGNRLSLIMLPKTIAETLQISTLDYSDYLMALLRLTDTIVEFTTSCIIKTSISSDGTDKSKIPFTISVLNSKLLTKTLQGFQLLDLKNDRIRRKFDGLKYNVKKVNEIVYDLSLRGLIIKDYELN